jgi:hypothetical protein
VKKRLPLRLLVQGKNDFLVDAVNDGVLRDRFHLDLRDDGGFLFAGASRDQSTGGQCSGGDDGVVIFGMFHGF